MFSRNNKFIKTNKVYGILTSISPFPDLDKDTILHLWIKLDKNDFLIGKFTRNISARIWENNYGLISIKKPPRFSDLSKTGSIQTPIKNSLAESIRDGIEFKNLNLGSNYCHFNFSCSITDIDTVNGFTIIVNNHDFQPLLEEQFKFLTILTKKGNKSHIRFH